MVYFSLSRKLKLVTSQRLAPVSGSVIGWKEKVCKEKTNSFSIQIFRTQK